MNVFECITTKRSVRHYEERPVAEKDMKDLIHYATMAANGSGMEPWGFVIINNKEEIEAWSEKIKAYTLAHLEDFPYLKQYEGWLSNPKFSVFNHAPTVMIIYGNTASH